MSHFYLKFKTDNAAFDDGHGGRAEIARILRELARRVEGGESMDKHSNILDNNGNIVGTFVHKEMPDT